jgi:Integrase zinc binding domain
MMSRLQSEDPAIAEPTQAVDTEVPCFALADERDPSLFHPHDLRAAQISDPSCSYLHAQYGAHPIIDIDQKGLIGLVLPSGEFQLAVPPLLGVPLPLSLITEIPGPDTDGVKCDKDAPDVKRGEVLRNENRTLFDYSNEVIAPLTEELPQVISHEEIRDEQSRDFECQELGQRQGASCVTDFNTEGILIRHAPVDGSKQIVVPLSLRPRILRLEHFPVVAGHPGVSKMYASMRRKFSWKMYKDVEETVRHCTVCAKNCVTEQKRTSFLKLIPVDGPLEFVSMEILGPLPKTEHGNRFLLVISDRF